MTVHSNEALKWFVNRFLQDERNRAFVLMHHGLQAKSPDQAKKWRKYLARNRHLQFTISPADTESAVFTITPMNSHSRWLEGTIYVKDDELHYHTESPNLFNLPKE